MSRGPRFPRFLKGIDVSLILVIEDDIRIQKALHRQFTTEGYEVHVTGDGAQGLANCKSLKPAGVVLDLMLPSMSGLEVCKGIKSWSASTPVVVLSAVSEVADKVLLLELGADDYVTKPFSPRELMARVQAAMRRAGSRAETTSVTFGDITVDFSRMQLTRNSQNIPLTAQEFKVLKFFVSNPERVISREELLNKVWGYNNNYYPSTRTVDNQLV